MFQGMLSRYGFEVFPVRPTSQSHTEISTHHKINLNLTHRGEGGVSQHSISNIRTNAREGYGARLATSRSQVRVPSVQPEDRGSEKQSNHHAERNHHAEQSNSTQACRPAQRCTERKARAAQKRAHCMESFNLNLN